MKPPKQLKPFLKAAREQGWRERQGAEGIVLYPPNGTRPITLHPNAKFNGRALQNWRTQFRRAGLEID